MFNLTSLTLTTRQFTNEMYYDNNFIVIHKNCNQYIMPNTQSNTDNAIALNNEITENNTVKLTYYTLTTRQFPTEMYYDNNFIVIHKNCNQYIIPNTQSNTDNDIALNNEITADNTVNGICMYK